MNGTMERQDESNSAPYLRWFENILDRHSKLIPTLKLNWARFISDRSEQLRYPYRCLNGMGECKNC